MVTTTTSIRVLDKTVRVVEDEMTIKFFVQHYYLLYTGSIERHRLVPEGIPTPALPRYLAWKHHTLRTRMIGDTLLISLPIPNETRTLNVRLEVDIPSVEQLSREELVKTICKQARKINQLIKTIDDGVQALKPRPCKDLISVDIQFHWT
jgi:hypothetical protein